MKRTTHFQLSITFFLILALLSPTAAFAVGDGKKHFKNGMKHEHAEDWDRAAESFALAVAENPKNPEYRLHLQRALFNASQLYMRKGAIAAQEKDYEGAYNAFRKAYAFDPVNELAKSEMARMVRLQKELVGGETDDKDEADDGRIKLVQTSYPGAKQAVPVNIPQKLEQIRHVPFPGGVNLQFIVKQLAGELDLNVLFDADSRLEGRTVRIDLKNVTAAKALDYIFLQENLFFQKVGPRTILVANGQRRVNFQQLVLKTFYLANASPKDVKAVITAAIPPQPGRTQTNVLEDAATNSVTIRDTSENIELIGRLIQSLDKDRAEVVMDVAIYEVNKSDLLQFGNQMGTAGSDGTLRNLGGVGLPLITGGTPQQITGGLPFKGFDLASVAIGLPISSIAALQSKQNTKLLASTQIHSFNNEESTARIGQRVPVTTASFNPYNTGTPNNNNNQNNFYGNVVNYEQVGLTLKFKPIVFPNHDVQVVMDIESKDVAGALTDQPVFTERKITGTARIQNNKTLLLASVAQNTETNGRQGLPLLGLIPIIGRLFSAPTKDNRQVDIVIAITPRVIRAPAILPEDLVERPTGSLQTPTSGSLEAMIIQEDRDELLALARQLPKDANVQMPDQVIERPAYVRSDAATPEASQSSNVSTSSGAGLAETLNVKPIDAGVKTLQIRETSDSREEKPIIEDLPKPSDEDVKVPVDGAAEFSLPATMPQLKAGEKVKLAVALDNSRPFRSVVVGLKFDEKKLAIRKVSFGDVFGSMANTPVLPFLNEKGKMFVSLSPSSESAFAVSGIVAFIEVEALSDGIVELAFEKDVLNLLAVDGRNVAVKF